MNLIKINSVEEIMRFGQNLIQQSHNILLYGELGAGKTYLTKGIATGLGINSNQVKSPTYTYMNEYDNILLHLDLYRLGSEADFISKGILNKIEEYLGADKYIVIEWPKFEKLYFDNNFIQIKINKIGGNIREIKINCFQPGLTSGLGI